MNLVQRKMKPSGVDWIGDVPEGWDVTRFGYHATVKANLVDVDDYGSFPQISPENIEKNTGRLLAHGTVEDSGVISGNHLFKQGQILYSKIRPALNKVTIAPYPGLCCADMYPIETDEDARYMIYLMLADCFVKQAEMVANMRIKMPKINQDELARIHIAVPPLDEQRRIAAKLDRLCGRVDELTENIKGEIAALQEYRKSLITECVTKGLNPRVKMKPSGVDWIGDVPEGWGVQRVGLCFRRHGSGTTPASTNSAYYEGENNWVQSGDLHGDAINKTEKQLSDLALQEYSLTVYKAPFIAVAMYGASIANTSRVMIDACTNQACCVLYEPEEDFDLDYCFYAIKAARKVLIEAGRGGGQPNINRDVVRKLKIPIPSFDEQSRIATFLDKRCAVIDAKIAERQRQLEKLGEYRSSVIYEYVTGKREVSA